MCSQWTSPSPPNTHSIAAVSALPRHLRHLESTLSLRVCQAAHLSGVRCGQVHDGLLSSLPTFTQEILTNLHRLVMSKLLIGSWNPGRMFARHSASNTGDTRVWGGLLGVKLTSCLPLFLSVTSVFPSQVPQWVYWWSLPKLRNGQLLQYVYFLFLSVLGLEHAQSALPPVALVLCSWPTGSQIRQRLLFLEYFLCFPFLLFACLAFINLVLFCWMLVSWQWLDKVDILQSGHILVIRGDQVSLHSHHLRLWTDEMSISNSICGQHHTTWLIRLWLYSQLINMFCELVIMDNQVL